MKLKTVLNVLLFLAAATPAFADSKSVTVQVSCVVPAMIEMAALPSQAVTVRSNLANQYQMTEDRRSQDGRSVRLYSLTAL